MPLITQGKTNWKYILIVLILAIAVGGGTFLLAEKVEILFTELIQTKKPEIKPEIKVPNTPIIYLKEERIDNLSSYNVLYSFNPATKNKQSLVKDIDEKITEGYKYYSIVSYSLSFDKKMVAYILEPLGGHPKTPLRNFNLITGEDKLLHTFTQNPSLEIIGWSPDDKYLALRWEKEFKGSFIKLIDSITGEEKLSLEEPTDYYLEIRWLNNESLIYNQIQIVLKRENKEKNLEGIQIINVKGDQKILQQATELKDYYIMKVLDDGRVVFFQEEVKSSDDWWVIPIPSKKTYWLMNQEGENLTQISEKGAMDLIREPDIEVLLSKELLSGYMKEPAVLKQKPFSKDRNWWLFTMTQRCPVDAIKCFPPNDIFIINVKDKTSLIKIDENVSILEPDW